MLGIALGLEAVEGSLGDGLAAAALVILAIAWTQESNGQAPSPLRVLMEVAGLTLVGVQAGGPMTVLLLLYARESSFALHPSVRRAILATALYGGIYAAVIWRAPPGEVPDASLLAAFGSGFPLASVVLHLLAVALTGLASAISRERATTDAVASLVKVTDLHASLGEAARVAVDTVRDDAVACVVLVVDSAEGTMLARATTAGMHEVGPPHVYLEAETSDPAGPEERRIDPGDMGLALSSGSQEAWLFKIPLVAGEGTAGALLTVSDSPLSNETKDALTTIAHATGLALEREALVRERHATQSEARFRSLVQNSSDVIFVVERDLGIGYASSPVRTLLGHDPEWYTERSFAALVHPRDLSSVMEICEQATPGVAGPPLECRLCRADETWIDVELVVSDLSADPNVGGMVLTVRDISERRKAQERLRRQAFHDQLTGLPNRALFLDRLRHALERRKRRSELLAVLFLDLDRFKNVNDSLGHLYGDQLLVRTAARLRGVLRPEDTVARIGGDEFAILLEETGEAEAALVADRVADAMLEPFVIDGSDVRTSASIGITVCDVARDPEEVLREADVAMYVAKDKGRGRSETFRPQMHADVLQRIELEDELRRAIERDQLTVHFQPIVDLSTGLIIGTEALVRWEHPEKGLVPPSEFVELAEETGQIVALDERVLERACVQTREWQDSFPGEGPLSVSVNLSGRDLFEPTLVQAVEETLERIGLPARSLTLEITEGVLAEDVESTIARLKALKELGVRLALDDFGTGYSSLSYLQRFPLDMLKVDRSFISGLAGGPEDSALARAVIKIGRTLRMLTVAEGIENQAQLSELRLQRCHYGQGYYFSRPVSAPEMSALLRRQALLADRWFEKPQGP